MEERFFEVEVFKLTLASAHSKAQEFIHAVQQGDCNGLGIDSDYLHTCSAPKNKLEQAEIMRILLETCLQLSSKIVHMSLGAALGNVHNSILFREILASPQCAMCTLSFWRRASMTLDEAQYVHDGVASNKTLQCITIGSALGHEDTTGAEFKVLSALAKRESCLKKLRLFPSEDYTGAFLNQVIKDGKCPMELDFESIEHEDVIPVLANYISSTSCHLTSLRIGGHNELPNLGVLCNALPKNESLTSICFSGAHFEVQSLAPTLCSHKAMTSLGIPGNSLDDGFIKEFCSHWLQDSQLESLDFSDNGIGPNGAAILVDAIVNHPTMKTLKLSGNRTLGFEGLTVIGKALPCLQLTSINLNNCSNFRTWNGFNNNARVACNSEGQALLEGIQANTFLQKMDVLQNGFAHGFCKKIDFWISFNQKICTVLAAEQHKLPNCVWCHFFGKLSCSPIRVYTMLQQQPHVLM